MRTTRNNSWFSNNPKRAWILLSGILLGVIIIILFVFEAIATFDLLTDKHEMNTNLRVTRLREYRANEGGPHLGIDPGLQELVVGINQLRIDSDGFILPGPVHIDPELKVFFIGGSTTACTWVDEDKRFPYLVGRRLEDKLGTKVNTYNGGVDGSNSMHSLGVLMYKVIPYKPEIVVLKHNINDLVTLLYTGSYWNDAITKSLVQSINNSEADVIRSQLLGNADGPILAVFPALYEKSHYLYLRITNQDFPKIDEWRGYRGRTVQRAKNELLDQFENSLTSFVHLCRSWGIKPVLMTQASNWDLPATEHKADEVLEMTIENDMPSNSFIPNLHSDFNQRIREVAEKNAVLLIDLERKVPSKNTLFQDAVHYNNAGSEYVAKVISNALSGLIQGDTTNKGRTAY